MPLAPAASALAQQTMRDAFENFEQAVTPADSRTFRDMTLDQVRKAALELEAQLASRQALCNMRRLAPLFQGLEHYSKAVEILCNGTPFLSWIWAPVTVILRVASEYGEAFERVMKGYSRIADCLGRFAILSRAFINDADFQQNLAIFYADILQFHKHAYKFVKRSGWRILFLTSWGRFERRFDNIIENLDRHGALIDQDANARNIAASTEMRQEVRNWREQSLDKVKQDEERQAAREFQSIVSWLKVDEIEQMQIFETISDEGTKFPGTCSWLLKNENIKSWLQRKPDTPLLWLQGNPGCGKSVIAAKLVDFLQVSKLPIIHHFCTYTYSSSTKYDGILRSILQQLLRKNGEFVAHMYQECIVGKHPPTTNNLERLIETFIATLCDEPGKTQYMWIVVDGINECEAARQSRLITLLNQISSMSSTNWGTVCKVLITTRPSPTISKYFRKDHVIFLSDEASPLQSAIRTYVTQRLRSLDERFRQLELEPSENEEIHELVVKKAGGMFLYARLVLDYISANIFYDGDELKEAINQLPETLAEFYHKLLAQILARLSETSQDRVRCIFSWIAFAKRPLKKTEFLSALSFTSGNPEISKLVPRYIVEDVCSPLIEERRDTSLGFIHVSVKHFLQSKSSAISLKEEDALYEHGIATISCLLSGLRVFNASYSEHARLLRLVKGMHGFHVYATEYWTEYLLANGAQSGGLEKAQKLLALATQLANELENMNLIPPPQVKSSPNDTDTRLRFLEPYRILQKHIERALISRSQKRLEAELFQETGVDGKDISPVHIPIDGISVTLNSYQTAVETLLDQDSCPGASIEELDQFKSHFRTSAYTCRLRSCPRATIGFQSDLLRREHERAHAGGFRCSIPGCQYPPFRSSKALASHVRTNHHQTHSLPRKSIRRVGHLELEKERLKSGEKKRDKNDSAQSSHRNKAHIYRDDPPSFVSMEALELWQMDKQTYQSSSSLSSSPSRAVKRKKRMEPGCSTCSDKNLRCDRARPTCANCKLWSWVCSYPNSCEACAAHDSKCGVDRPECKGCKCASDACPSGDHVAPDDGNDTPGMTRSGETIDPHDLVPTSEQPQSAQRKTPEESQISQTKHLQSDLLGSSGIGVGYLDILLAELGANVSLDPQTYNQIRSRFNHDMVACWKLVEIVDNITVGSRNITTNKIISEFWSEQPELSEKLRELFSEGNVPSQVIEDSLGSESSDGDSDDDATLHEQLHNCFCNAKSSEPMIRCHNSYCSREWFHLHCVNLVVTPDEDKKWFCSISCEKEWQHSNS